MRIAELEEWADYHSIYQLAKVTKNLRESCKGVDFYSKRIKLNERVHEAKKLIASLEKEGVGCIAYTRVIRLVEIGFSIDTTIKDPRWRKFWQNTVTKDEIELTLEKMANLLNDFALEFSFNCPNINTKNFVLNVINFKKKWYRKNSFKKLE
ncbi:Oidioi.mRNA.OKI2018_I69.chr2.g4588.t2.cds [Oikopleura dioica]|uniref:Oidioi.mRNA.OKI2018_I69.chr2.g4588.t2.cds n=1 Tax=Oikopleura dioica TaxID=34765 RepID=A0ABN7T4E3_OIKDI|nr:Oidioi.mRNA.OKI2018_I69.chr2.g4588.t2.cds [Oikopleura dioica]